MPDAGCRMPDAGCRMPDAGCRMPDAGCRMPDAGGVIAWIWYLVSGIWYPVSVRAGASALRHHPEIAEGFDDGLERFVRFQARRPWAPVTVEATLRFAEQ